MPEDKKAYAEKVCHALQTLREQKIDAKSAAKKKEFMSTATLATRPSKDERQLKAAARRVSIQMAQLKRGSCVQSVCYRTTRRY